MSSSMYGQGWMSLDQCMLCSGVGVYSARCGQGWVCHPLTDQIRGTPYQHLGRHGAIGQYSYT